MGLKNIKQAAQNIRLSHDEKAVMRAKIFNTIEGAKYAPVRSLVTVSTYSWFSTRFAAPMAALLIVALGSGTAYAAQGALPGGVLYPVKIYVNEAVVGALAVSDEARLSFHTSMAEERLKEAETLAAQGRLSEEATVQIETSFEKHVGQADELAQAIEDEDPSAGVEAKITLNSSISAHQSILARIGRGSDNAVTQENSNSLAARVRSRDTGEWEGGRVAVRASASATANTQTMSLMASGQNEASTSEDTSGPGIAAKQAPAPGVSSIQKKIVFQLQKKALAELANVREAYADARGGLDATTTATVDTRLTELDEQKARGEEEVKAEDYDAARASFTAVLSGSLELETLIEASAKFDADFVRPWEEKDEDGGDNHDNDNDDEDSHEGTLRLPGLDL